ncbi:DUF2085 domain-containing protein [Clostridium intestinale]|jgi:uncharacterized membrane protein|uniref:DUF2085 domain-containing protein n=1 Tax=Clostridium intestinale URNW TaxID=1294142 RepID=U2NNZ5_9CLOT|nr:DUF2085 domain-containing protein [Clostridium intestinale]ERK30898.1 hypothetical protein CINTURNW_1810 [Clostridium intestinale URNW]
MKFFSTTCHQKSDRSFFINKYQFPLCARCTGLLLGYILGILFLFFFPTLPTLICLSFLAIMFIDWFLQHKKIKESTNYRRLITGFLCGLGIISILSNTYLLLKNIFFTLMKVPCNLVHHFSVSILQGIVYFFLNFII